MLLVNSFIGKFANFLDDFSKFTSFSLLAMF